MPFSSKQNRFLPLRGRAIDAVTSFQEREFAIFFGGSFAFFLGMAMQILLRNIVVFNLTDSAFALSIMVVVAIVVLPITAPLGGVVADRVNKKTLLVICEALSTLLFGVITFLILIDKIEFWHLLVTSPIFAAIFSFIMPTRQAIVPALVPAQKLTNAISLNAGGNTITQIIGPAIAGILVGFADIGIAFLVATILFGIATLSDLRLPKYGMVGNKKPKSFVDDLKGGAKYILGNRLVFLLLFANFLMPLFTFPLQQMMVVFVREVHGLSDDWLGYFLMILGIGSLIGILVMTSADRIKHKGYLLMFGGFLTGVSMFAFAATSNIIFALIMLGIVGLGEIIFGITNQAEIQRSITNEMRGRVMSVTMLSISVWPIAILPIGIATDAFGPGPTLSVTAVLYVVALIALFGFSATLRKLYVDKRKSAELSHVQAAQLVAEGKITEEEAAKLTGESEELDSKS